MLGKYEIFKISSNGVKEKINVDIISSESQNSLFQKYEIYSFKTTFNGELLPCIQYGEVYYDGELKLNGFLTCENITPFNKIQEIKAYPVTYHLDRQGVKAGKQYLYQNFIDSIKNVIIDNTKGAKQSVMNINGLSIQSIKFDSFEFGIIPPLKRNIALQTEANAEGRDPKIGLSIFDYIEKLANQNMVHITTIAYKGKTYLYFLDDASVIQDKILRGAIPKILTKDLQSVDSFNIRRNPLKNIDEYHLYSDAGVGDFNETTSTGTHSVSKINLDNLFKNLSLDQRDFLKKLYKSELNLVYSKYELKEAIIQKELLASAGKFIAENTLAQGMVIECNITIEKDLNGVDFLPGSFIDISDLFINAGLTDKRISPQAFIISGITTSYNKQTGLINTIYIAPSFLLEN